METGLSIVNSTTYPQVISSINREVSLPGTGIANESRLAMATTSSASTQQIMEAIRVLEQEWAANLERLQDDKSPVTDGITDRYLANAARLEEVMRLADHFAAELTKLKDLLAMHNPQG